LTLIIAAISEAVSSSQPHDYGEVAGVVSDIKDRVIGAELMEVLAGGGAFRC
jgi:hypothetical protein